MNLRAVAVKSDGSGLAMATNCCTIAFLDANFNVLGTFTEDNSVNMLDSGLVYSLDGSRLYAPFGPSIGVIDTESFQSLEQLPPLAVSLQNQFHGWDGEQRLLGLDMDGVDLVDASIASTALPQPIPTLW